MENMITNPANFTSSVMQNNPMANVDLFERYISLGTGAFISLKGITNIFSHPWIAMTELAVGGSLLYRGITGHCPIKERFEQEPDPISAGAMPTEAY